MKSFAKSPAVALAFIVLANVATAHAAGMPAHHGHHQMAGGMQTKAMTMMMKQIPSSFSGENPLMSGNINPADFLSQMQR
jgi:hypothetical protein